MAIKIKDAGGTLRTITSIKVQDGGTLRPVQTVKILDGSTLRTVAELVSSLTVAITPDTIEGGGRNSGITSNAATATPTGGLAPYTYAWVITSGTATATSPTLATTTFRQEGIPEDTVMVATAQVTVTDAIGQTATDTTGMTFTRTYFGEISTL